MTHQSYSNSVEDGALESPSCSNSTESSQVYSLPLGLPSQIDICNEDQRLVSILNDLPISPNPIIIDSNGVKIGTEFNVTVQGDAHFHTNATGTEPPIPIPNGSCTDGQVVSTNLTPTATKVPKSLKYFLKDRPTQFWLAGLLLAVMSISSLVLFFSLYDYNPPTPAPPTFGHDDNLGDDIQIINRKEWLARDPLNTTLIVGPLKMVRILHTASEYCSDYQTCANKILGLQGIQVVNQNLPDIAYNFMIGGDGNVYIGRGAEVANDGKPEAYDIAYVGNFLPPYDKMSVKMNEAGKRLIKRLLDRGKLTTDYIVVAHNQTEKTTSPGKNVFKKIVFWPHYDSGSYFEN